MQLNQYGWLEPPELIESNRQTVEQLFVTNPHRYKLWSQFIRFLESLDQQGIPQHAVWIDGSFLSSKEEPSDIDAVVFIEIAYLNAHFSLLDRLRNQFADLDVYWASSSSKTDPLSVAITSLERMKWDSVFGINRAKQAKGYIQLVD